MPSSLPSTAPAILLHEFATDLHSLSPTDVPVTRPGPGFVLIKVSHVAPTFGDGLVATGKYQTKPKLPFVPGTECAGIVVAVGEGVKNFKEGMRVLGFNNPAGPAQCWTSYSLFPAFDATGQSFLYECPPSLRLREGVAVLANYATALYALREIAGWLKPSEPVSRFERPNSQRIAVVHGGAGGMGTSSIHLLKHYLGVGTVIATTSTPEKAAIAKSCGADYTVDYTKEGWWNEVKRISRAVTPGAKEAETGADLIIETVGSSLDGSIKCARWGAKILVIGFAGGQIPNIRPNVLLVKGISIHGTWLGGVPTPAHSRAIFRRLLVETCGLPLSSPTLSLAPDETELEPLEPSSGPLFKPVLYPLVLVGLGSVSKAITTMHGRGGYGKVVVDLVGEDEESRGAKL